MEYCCTKFQVGLNFRLCDVFIPQFLWLRGRWPPGCRQTAVCALCAGLEAGFSCSKVLLGPIRQKGRTEAGQGTTPPRMVSHQTRSLSEQDKLLPNARVSGLHGEVAVLACPSPGGRSQPCPGPRGWERSRAGVPTPQGWAVRGAGTGWPCSSPAGCRSARWCFGTAFCQDGSNTALLCLGISTEGVYRTVGSNIQVQKLLNAFFGKNELFRAVRLLYFYIV